jgi:hypothetical protein
MPGCLKDGEGLSGGLGYCIKDGEAEALMEPKWLETLGARIEVVPDILRGCLTAEVKAQEPFGSYKCL